MPDPALRLFATNGAAFGHPPPITNRGYGLVTLSNPLLQPLRPATMGTSHIPKLGNFPSPPPIERSPRLKTDITDMTIQGYQKFRITNTTANTQNMMCLQAIGPNPIICESDPLSAEDFRLSGFGQRPSAPPPPWMLTSSPGVTPRPVLTPVGGAGFRVTTSPLRPPIRSNRFAAKLTMGGPASMQDPPTMVLRGVRQDFL